MPRSHLPCRKDANQKMLDERFRQNFCSVVDTSVLGNDFPDSIVGYGGFSCLIEYKVPGTGKLSPGQERFHRDWKGAVRVARTPEDVDEIAAWMRAQAARMGR